jgi:hypothetical protein
VRELSDKVEAEGGGRGQSEEREVRLVCVVSCFKCRVSSCLHRL